LVDESRQGCSWMTRSDLPPELGAARRALVTYAERTHVPKATADLCGQIACSGDRYRMPAELLAVN
jgi:hypothetical protein